MNVDLFLKICCGMMVNAVSFGVGAVTVLATPALAEYAACLLPAVVIASFVVSPFIASLIAPRLRHRNWGYEGWLKGDIISG